MTKYTEWVTKFRVTPEQKSLLEAQSEIEGCSETDILRKALLEYLRRVVR